MAFIYLLIFRLILRQNSVTLDVLEMTVLFLTTKKCNAATVSFHPILTFLNLRKNIKQWLLPEAAKFIFYINISAW